MWVRLEWSPVMPAWTPRSSTAEKSIRRYWIKTAVDRTSQPTMRLHPSGGYGTRSRRAYNTQLAIAGRIEYITRAGRCWAGWYGSCCMLGRYDDADSERRKLRYSSSRKTVQNDVIGRATRNCLAFFVSDARLRSRSRSRHATGGRHRMAVSRLLLSKWYTSNAHLYKCRSMNLHDAWSEGISSRRVDYFKSYVDWRGSNLRCCKPYMVV